MISVLDLTDTSAGLLQPSDRLRPRYPLHVMVYILGIVDFCCSTAYGSAETVGGISGRSVVRLLRAAEHLQCHQVTKISIMFPAVVSVAQPSSPLEISPWHTRVLRGNMRMVSRTYQPTVGDTLAWLPEVTWLYRNTRNGERDRCDSDTALRADLVPKVQASQHVGKEAKL